MTNDVPNMIEVDPTTICQCTGLKDKNGNLIWQFFLQNSKIHLVKNMKENKVAQIGCDNAMKCKQRFLDIMSKEFDKVVNEKLGDYGFYKENK